MCLRSKDVLIEWIWSTIPRVMEDLRKSKGNAIFLHRGLAGETN